MHRLRNLFLFPAMLVMGTLFLGPLLITISYGFLTRGSYGGVVHPWTAASFGRAFDPLYLGIIWRSIWVAAASTALCLVSGFPLALTIARAQRHRTLLLTLVMLPFWTSFLIRTYAWMFLLRDTGLFNSTLLAVHVIREPLPLLFNSGAVIVGLVYGYLPYMVLPLFAAIEKMDPTLLDAAADLGARPLATVFRVVAPLAKPGIVAGCLLVFIPTLGAYLTPDLMGGGKTVMIGTIIQNQFTSARDWPFGAALSVLLLALTLAVSGLIRRRGQDLL